MIPVDEARARILAGLRPTPSEMVPLSCAWDRVTAAPATSRLTHPPHDVSAMDGYAVRAADAMAGTTLRVVGSSPAGHPWQGSLGPGETIAIFTGSLVPDGADGILMQEDADRSDDRVTLRDTVLPGRWIRRAGQDFAAGDALVAAGRRLNARDIGLLAAGNHPWVQVHRRPRIAILATGDEIALPGDPIPAGGIVSSNAHALAALARACGADPVVLPIAPDDRATLATAAEAAAGMDLLVTSGGASVGAHDLVRSALSDRGLEVDFWTVAIRPGKPLIHGRLGGVPMIGLPGNPVSSLVCAIVFLLPALRRLAGLPGDAPPTEPAILGAPLAANDRRHDHLRATLAVGADGILVATPFPRQDSALLRLMAQAEALILREPDAPALPAGAPVRIIRLDTLGV
jgi:molybdopterin molybdotransferase